jgi:hypothetical protein
MELNILGLGGPWRDFGKRIFLTAQYSKTLEGCIHYIFVDAYDT